MARKAMKDVASRTVRVHIPSYDSILEFFALSPTGLRGSDVIRRVLIRVGKYCQDQMDAGKQADFKDLAIIEELVQDVFNDSKK